VTAPRPERRLHLRHILLLVLLLTGSIPLILSSGLLIRQNRLILEDQERTHLASSAQALSREVSSHLATLRRQLSQVGAALLAPPGPAAAEARLKQAWVRGFLRRVMTDDAGDLLALRVLETSGTGPRVASDRLGAAAQTALDAAFEAALSSRSPVYEFTVLPEDVGPAAVLAVPVFRDAGEPVLVVEGLLRLGGIRSVFGGASGIFLLGDDGEVLWSEGNTPEMTRALAGSPVVRDFLAQPLSLSGEYTVEVDGEPREILVQMSPVEEAGWAVVAQRPLAAAFASVDRMVFNTVISSLLLIALALLFALFFARRLSQPIQRLAATSREIADGNFGRRVEASGLAREIADLAGDFNRMSEGMESQVERLRDAARQNRELFLGTLRAFVAAVDAKDPYTRGHSERVAAIARAIGDHLALPEPRVNRLWIAALVHDVGKIGIDDRISKKGGVLTADEYEQMKAHPGIGADILAPIEQLKDTLPAVRWHHESWNGRGYPDGLKGEEIPLEARIVAIADTFDAVTTNRPYQEAFTPSFAVETITKLAGSRFDAKIVTAFLSAWEKGEIVAVDETESVAEPVSVEALGLS